MRLALGGRDKNFFLILSFGYGATVPVTSTIMVLSSVPETAVRGSLHCHVCFADHNSDHDSASNGGDITGMPSLI